MKRIEDSLRELWGNIKCTNTGIIGVPEEEEKKKEKTDSPPTHTLEILGYMLIWRGIWIYGPAEISINRRKSIALSTWSLVLYLFGIKELLENTGSPPRMILPPGDTGCRLETFLVVIAGEGCSWHLLGRGQGCCWTSYNARDSPPSHPRHTHIHREREKLFGRCQ